MRRQTDDEETECTCPEGTDPQDCNCDDADDAGEMMDSNSVFIRGASFAPQSFNADKRTVGVVWSTGAPVQRMDWDGPYAERLDLSPDAVDLIRTSWGAGSGFP